jgi:hypothetical protein
MEKSLILKELARELEMRRSVYPRWVQQNKLSAKTAEHRIQVIEAAIALIECMEDEGEIASSRVQLDLFSGGI